MSTFKTFLFFLVWPFFLSSCSQEDSFPIEKDYPIVVTNEPFGINENGVNFSASLISTGNQEITDFGFIWQGNGVQFEYSLFHKSELGDFELLVNSDLERGIDYNCRSYIRTIDLLVLGNDVTFASRGVSNPEIKDFSPKSGDSGDTLTITGNYFSVSKSRTQVYLGDDLAEVVHVDFDNIKVLVPQTLTKSGDVKIILTSGNINLESNDAFSIDGHRITDITPKRGIIGETEITILGTDFYESIDSNQVFVDTHQATVLEARKTQLRIRLPYALSVGESKISVTVKHKKFTFSEPIQILSRWRKMKPFPGSPRVSGNFIIRDNLGYYIGGSTLVCCDALSEVWQYNFQTDSWGRLSDFPGAPRKLAVAFNLGEKIYYGTGAKWTNGFSDFWEYDPGDDTWNQLSDFPGAARHGSHYFSIDAFGYLIGGSNGSDEVWKYDPSSDSWQLIGGTYRVARSLDYRKTFFEYGGKGYIIPFFISHGSNTTVMYRFNPSIDGLFDLVAGVPFRISYLSWPAIVFVLNDILYLGGTTYTTEVEPRVWTYNFGTGVWKRIENFRGGLSSLKNSFSYQDKGFVGFRVSAGSINTDIWVYDPEIQ